jgi:DNA-binding NarL/FixJ family response regulator
MRIVIAEDNTLLREGIPLLLVDHGVETVARCETADALLEAVRAHAPDLAIVDIRLPPTHSDEGLRAAEEIRTAHPGTSVLVLSSYIEPELALRLVDQGVEGTGYLLKDRIADVDEFAATLRRVAAGGTALDPTLVSQLLGGRRDDDPLDQLTPREREVLELMAEGRTNAAIARAMVVKPGAVEKHISSIFGKLGLPASDDDHRRVLAVLAYLRNA